MKPWHCGIAAAEQICQAGSFRALCRISVRASCAGRLLTGQHSSPVQDSQAACRPFGLGSTASAIRWNMGGQNLMS